MTPPLSRPLCVHGNLVDDNGGHAPRYILIEEGAITAVTTGPPLLPPNTLLVELEPNDLVFPGFLNLHTHTDYNTLPIWRSPYPRWSNRFEWIENDVYQRDIPDRIVAVENALGPEALRVFQALSEIQAIAGGSTVLQEPVWLPNPARKRPMKDEHVLVRSTGVATDIGLPPDEEIDSVVDFYTPRPTPSGTPTTDTGHWRAEPTSNLEAWLAAVGGSTIQGTLAHLAEGRSGVLLAAEGVDPYSRHEFETFMTTVRGLDPQAVRAMRPTLIHACGANVWDPATLEFLTEFGVSVIWSPVSNLLLYQDTTWIPPLLDNGTTVALGSDWSPSGSKHVWDEAKFARFFFRALGYPVEDRVLYRMITTDAAKTIGLTRSGRIAPGGYGDLFVLRNHAPSAEGALDALFTSSDADVLFVTVGGMPLYGDAAFVERFGLPFEPLGEGGVAATKAVHFPETLDFDYARAVSTIDTLLLEHGVTRSKFLVADDAPYRARLAELRSYVDRYRDVELYH